MLRVRLALFGIAILGVSPRAFAQADFVGVRALGMGEALRASASGASGLLLNPAGMSLTKQYVVDAMYGFRVEDLGHHVFVGVVDSVTSRLAAGLYYEYIHTSPRLTFDWAGGRVTGGTLSRTGHVAGLALSIALGDYVMLGVNTKYLHLDTNAPLPEGTHPASLSFDSLNGITFDVGLLFRLGDKFRLATVAYNLWDHGSAETPLSLGFGAALNPIPALSINFDAVINFTGDRDVKRNTDGTIGLARRTTARLGPGIEYVIADRVPVRFGVVYDTTLQGGGSRGATALTAGVGYASQKFGIDLSYRGRVEGGAENFLMLGVRLFVK
jgi:hypothetical protein